ncbi:hypothetical protein I3842_16G031400 [Carya illinoinensis]|uniref:Uncharacterized protein n=1 Tax=Carya illinoinensis TaxID=32201 RepID=A0A921ZZQ4_CARIL|nr:hypothetical protein I3842_16G031400 [Carya illinoinensis]
MGVRYLLMTLVFYGGLLLLFGSTAFMGAHASMSYYFDHPQSNHFYPKYLKVVSRKKSTPPPPAPIRNVRRQPFLPIPPMPKPRLQPPPPPPPSSWLKSSALP